MTRTRESLEAELIGLMRYVSEEWYSAGWHCDLDRMLWGEFADKRISFRSKQGLLTWELDRLTELRDILGSWAYWSDESDDPVVVPISEWEKKRMIPDCKEDES